MTYKSKVAVIGTDNIGTAVATNLVKGNCPVIIANRKIENASALSQKLGNLAQPMQMPAAIKEAEIIVFAIWFDAVKELLNTYATELQGKIIVDPSNPIAPGYKGGFKKIIGEKESAGEILSSFSKNKAADYTLPRHVCVEPFNSSKAYIDHVFKLFKAVTFICIHH